MKLLKLKTFINFLISFKSFTSIVMVSVFLLGCQADVNGPLSLDSNEFSRLEFSSDPTILGISTSFDFGHVPPPASTSKLIYVLNSGTRDLNNLQGSLPATHFTYNGGVYPGIGGSCSTILIEGAQCILDLVYRPTAVPEVNTDTYSFTYVDDTGVPGMSSFDVIGTGDTPPVLSINPPGPEDYGNVTVGASSDITFNLINSGGSPALNISESTLGTDFNFSGGSFPGVGGTCTTTIPCQFLLIFLELA